MTRRGLALAACVAAVLASSAAARAHEIGTTRVSVVLEDDRRYAIEVVTDAAALLEKLELMAGREVDEAGRAEGAPDVVAARLAALDAVFRERAIVAFDAAAARPAIEYNVAPGPDAASPPRATVRLTGDVPPGAGHFTWTYGWTFATYALSVGPGADGRSTTGWLEGGETSPPVSLATLPPAPGRLATVWRYVALGFTHIVPHGLDHVLFVIGIFLLSRGVRSVVWQVSAFTCAHSITLALSVYDVIAIAPAIVEPLIALSIAYVAIENLFQTELRPWRVGLIGAFGLLHGLGFAGVLKEVGLPPSEYVTALLAFNIGVEAGQLAVIGAALALVGWHWRDRVSYRRLVVVPASVAIACAAVYWTVERVAF